MTNDTFVLLATAILGGGFLGGIALLLKVRPEAGSINVKAAETVVVMQTDYIERLETRLSDLEKEVGAARGLAGRVESLETELARTKRQRDQALSENDKLKERVDHLEQEVARLSAQTAGPDTTPGRL